MENDQLLIGWATDESGGSGPTPSYATGYRDKSFYYYSKGFNDQLSKKAWKCTKTFLLHTDQTDKQPKDKINYKPRENILKPSINTDELNVYHDFTSKTSLSLYSKLLTTEQIVMDALSDFPPDHNNS